MQNKDVKRYLICYKKQTENGYEKKIKIIPHYNEVKALQILNQRFGVPLEKISREAQKEGYTYCNEVYNPTNEELTDEDI